MSAPLKSVKRMSKNGKVHYTYPSYHFIDSEKYPLDPTKCGKRSNYIAHRKRAETPCDACIRANSQYHRNYRELRKLQKQVRELIRQTEEFIRNNQVTEGISA